MAEENQAIDTSMLDTLTILEDDAAIEKYGIEAILQGHLEQGIQDKNLTDSAINAIEELITIGTNIQQTNFYKAQGINLPTDFDDPNKTWDIDSEFDGNLSDIDWDIIEETHGFSRINPETGTAWTNTKELFDYFNTTYDIANSSLDPTVMAPEAHWDRYFSDNTGSKYPRIVGNDYTNYQNAINRKPQDNPYIYFSSAYVPGVEQYDYTYQGEPSYNILEANIAMNMFRFNIDELSPVEFKKFFGDNTKIQSDSFHPLSNVGDDEEWNTGISISPYVGGFLASKYNDLDKMVNQFNGHYVHFDENGTWGNHVKIDQPDNWYGKATDYNSTVDRTINLIKINDGLTQADFVGKFGPAFEYMGIFNSEKNTTGVSAHNTNINGYSFFAEESVPGFWNMYSAGNSMLALGMNFDPTSSDIQSARFGHNFPVPSIYSSPETYFDKDSFHDDGMHYYGMRNMIASHAVDYGVQWEDWKWMWEMQAGEDYNMGDTDYSVFKGFKRSLGRLGTNAYLGFDAVVQGQLFSHGMGDHGTFNPSTDISPYYDYSDVEYSKLTIGRGKNIHSGFGSINSSGSMADHGLPNFGHSLAGAGSITTNTNERAYQNAQLSFEKMLLYALNNASSTDYHIQKMFEDITSANEIIDKNTVSKVEQAKLIETLNDFDKTFDERIEEFLKTGFNK